MTAVAKARRRTPGGESYTLAARYNARFRTAFRAGIDGVVSSADLARLAQAVRSRSLAAIDRYVPPFSRKNPQSWASLQTRLEAQYQALIKASGKQEIARLDLPMSFNLQNPYSQKWITTQTANLVADVSKQARQNIKGLIRASFLDGVPPDTTARLIQGHIGLLPREAAAAERRFAYALDKGVPLEQATRAAERYERAMLAARAERIARTETIAAEAAGQLHGWQTAADEGLILEGTKREWVSSTEKNGACKGCAAMDKVKVAFGEPFDTPYGLAMAPPLHPSCRCTVTLATPAGG